MKQNLQTAHWEESEKKAALVVICCCLFKHSLIFNV